jgi:hypothetical protein
MFTKELASKLSFSDSNKKKPTTNVSSTTSHAKFEKVMNVVLLFSSCVICKSRTKNDREDPSQNLSSPPKSKKKNKKIELSMKICVQIEACKEM